MNTSDPEIRHKDVTDNEDFGVEVSGAASISPYLVESLYMTFILFSHH